jgi:hypothetical protein
MDGTTVTTQIEELRPEFGKIQKLLRKTRRSKGCNAEFYMIHMPLAVEHSAIFHTREELTTRQRENFRSLLYGDFSELL